MVSSFVIRSSGSWMPYASPAKRPEGVFNSTGWLRMAWCANIDWSRCTARANFSKSCWGTGCSALSISQRRKSLRYVSFTDFSALLHALHALTFGISPGRPVRKRHLGITWSSVTSSRFPQYTHIPRTIFFATADLPYQNVPICWLSGKRYYSWPVYTTPEIKRMFDGNNHHIVLLWGMINHHIEIHQLIWLLLLLSAIATIEAVWKKSEVTASELGARRLS